MTAVHPHACGEHVEFSNHGIALGGSSPRLWGTRVQVGPGGWVRRFIPTPVGNTAQVLPLNAGMPVHPHACGEHLTVTKLPTVNCGSSPRLWGTLAPSYRAAPPGRFIPTPVGNTAPRFAGARANPVHPHACGEHAWGLPSPAARGRFIPTPVGNTGFSGCNHCRPSVHPHACGEHAGDIATELHTRRFIPTPVGNTNTRKGRDLTASGSSPRLWGTHRWRFRRRGRGRFIPTPVGNTRASLTSASETSVHPHACGEHAISNLLISKGNFQVKKSTKKCV